MDSKKDILVFPSKYGQDWHHKNCFGCGRENPFSLKADFTFDEETGEVRFEYIIRSEYEGAPGYSHGGILASLLDEAQGCLCFHVGHVVMTEKLHINYHKAVPLNHPIQIRAWLTAVRKRRLYTRGVIYIIDTETKKEELYVSSSASWYVLPERVQRRIFQTEMPEEKMEKQRKILELNRKRAREIRLRLRKKNDL
jgi:acyl-coenzyme A thioesterase PaaI-like protein